MRKSLSVMTALLLSTLGTLAEQPARQKPDRSLPSGMLLPLKGASSANSCAAYGPGFIKVEGSGTCVRVGGSISVGVGTSGSPR